MSHIARRARSLIRLSCSSFFVTSIIHYSLNLYYRPLAQKKKIGVALQHRNLHFCLLGSNLFDGHLVQSLDTQNLTQNSTFAWSLKVCWFCYWADFATGTLGLSIQYTTFNYPPISSSSLTSTRPYSNLHWMCSSLWQIFSSMITIWRNTHSFRLDEVLPIFSNLLVLVLIRLLNSGISDWLHIFLDLTAGSLVIRQLSTYS